MIYESTTPAGYRLYQLMPSDWQLLKKIRLEALQNAPAMFGSNYAHESALPDHSWQDRLALTDRAYFGLLSPDRQPVGLTAVVAGNESATLIASYISEHHRGNGLTALFYQARINWAKANNFTVVVVSHRENNRPSKAAILRAGFTFTHASERIWPDGVPEQELFYTLRL